MSESTDLTYYQRNRDVVLNKAKDYYKNDKKRSREQARNKYRILSEEDKDKKGEYGRIDITISEEKKQGLKEYQKNYCDSKKSKYNNEKNIFFNHDLIQ